MKIITDDSCTSYSHPGHPERPERIIGTMRKLQSQTELTLTWAKPATVDDAILLRAHTVDHWERLNEREDFDNDPPYFPNIATLARAYVGAGVEALKAARAGETAFSLMRPPGHHCTRHRAMGFCYLSNMAITVLEAQATGAKRVAVFDFDVHHGNGTEAILLNKPGTTMFSIHQSPCYPGTGDRNVGDNCFNYPVPPRLPRTEYRAVLTSAMDALKKFKPEIIGISAGFDAYVRDPLAQETLEAEDFHWLGQSFRNMGIPFFSLLEGGYSDDLPELIFSYLLGCDGK